MANPTVNCYSCVDTPSITSLKIALIVCFFTNWSSPSCPLASLFIENSFIKEYHNIR